MSAAPLESSYDVAVVGAGPAGLAAAAFCARHKLSTLLLDEQPSPGGQIYRSITETPVARRDILGDDYWAGEKLVRECEASGARRVQGATVWSLTPELEIGVSMGGGSTLVNATHVVLATGALERPFPIPGWTLPGVMTAGAAQGLFKASGLLPAGRTVLAGTGPLLWLLAWQMLQAGTKLEAILDTTPAENRAAALRHALSFAWSAYLRKGLRLLWAVRGRVPVVKHVVELEAQGRDKLEGVRYRTASGESQVIAVDHLLLHQGVVPNVNLSMAAGLEHAWDADQLCFRPKVSPFGASSVPGIYVAGDGAGIAGAQAAAWRGVLAAADIVHTVAPEAAKKGAALARAALSGFERGRRFIDAYYRPAKHFRVPTGDTVVCRCEEITAKQVMETLALGVPGPNQLKSFLRCGMGPCQGRQCGLTVTEMIAEANGTTPSRVGYYRIRPPVKPITVAELAALPKSEAAVKAVVRI